jgi:hypothetical protein
MKNIFKKIGVSFLFFIGAFVFSQCGAWTSVHASVLYDNSYVDGTFPVTFGSSGSFGSIPGSTGTYGFVSAGSTVANGSDVKFVKMKALAGGSCPTITLFGLSGNSFLTDNTAPTAVSGFCTYPSTNYTSVTSGHTFSAFFISSNSGDNVFGSTHNAGYSFSGDGGGAYTGAGSIAFQLCDSGGCSGGFTSFVPLSTTSRIENITPALDSTAGSTSVAVSFDYYFNSSELPHPVDSIDMVLDRTDAPEAQVKYNVTPITMDTLETGITHTFTLTSDATYHLTFNINAKNYAGVEVSVPMSGIFSDFSVVADPTISSYATCDITSLAGCFQNVFTYLFSPSSASINNFKSLTLQGKFPFSYIYDVGTVYNELFANSGSMSYDVSVNTGALGTISFISASQISAVPYASTIKTLLGYLLYFFTAMTLYRMLLRTHDK